MDSASAPELKRVLGLREGIAIHVGNIIGSGIFIVPALMASQLHALGPILLVWVAAGLLTLFGALSLAELSSLLPEAGGPYVYLREGFGRFWGFLFVWNDFLINRAGTAAALAVAFSIYLGQFFPAFSPEHAPLASHTWMIWGYSFRLVLGWSQIAALLVLLTVTVVNLVNVRMSGWVMNVFTSIKVGALVLLILAAFLLGKGSAANLRPWWPEGEFHLLPAFGMGMVSALWAFDGWASVTLSAGEIKDPQRNVPRALLIGTLLVIGIYLAATLAYTFVIPVGEAKDSPRIAADVAKRILGPLGASLVAGAILCSTFGTANGGILTGPRSLYAAAKDGLYPARFANVHPRFGTPFTAVLVLAFWSALLVLSGTYEQIMTYVVFGSWAFYAITALAVIALRRKQPEAPRPYRTWAYPYATLAFVAAALLILVNTLLRESGNALIGIALILLSLPFYVLWRRK